jgi:nitrogen regulatory protein PII-like uncharacterized protein
LGDDSPESDPAFVAALRSSLAEHRALALIIHDYRQVGPDRDEGVILGELEEAEHEIIHTLARDLRGLGEAIGSVVADDRLLSAARRQKNRAARLGFLRDYLRKWVARYQRLGTAASSDQQRTQWAKLEAMTSETLA